MTPVPSSAPRKNAQRFRGKRVRADRERVRSVLGAEAAEKYRCTLGEGSYGRVVKVGCSAVKFFSGEDAVEVCAEEVEALQKTKRARTSPRAPRLLAYGPTWLATTLVPGPTVNRFAHTRGGMSRKELARFAAGLLTELTELHAAGFAHGDISGGNTIVTIGGAGVLIDMGAARPRHAEACPAANAVMAEVAVTPPPGYAWIGNPGTVTAPYRSPVACLGFVKDSAQDDCWAAGSVLLQLLAGNVPGPIKNEGVFRGAMAYLGADPTIEALLRAMPEPVRKVAQDAYAEEIELAPQAGATPVERLCTHILASPRRHPEFTEVEAVRPWAELIARLMTADPRTAATAEMARGMVPK